MLEDVLISRAWCWRMKYSQVLEDEGVPGAECWRMKGCQGQRAGG